MNRDAVEAALKAKIESGEADTGLFKVGNQHIVVDLVDEGKGEGDQYTFTWFDEVQSFDASVAK